MNVCLFVVVVLALFVGCLAQVRRDDKVINFLSKYLRISDF